MEQHKSTTNWEEINENTDLDKYAEFFRTNFLEIIESNTPTKTISIWPEDKRWMNKEIRKIMNKRNLAYKRAKGKPRDHPAWERHRKLCREKLAIAAAKEKRLKTLANKINRGHSSEKEWWSLARDIYRPKSETEGSP